MAGIAYHYSNLLRSGFQISVGARFPEHIHTRPEVYPASCPVGTGSPFRDKKRPEIDADHPPPYMARVSYG
jgi:hypothetical protein